MKLIDLHVRFYKAFNFDYLRKFHGGADARPWETMEDGSWYPFVTVTLEPDITTVVGANESGKSQILKAIEIALTGKGVTRTDFCRYSRFFLVDNVRRLPDFGATFSELSADQAAQLASICKRGQESPITTFTLIRDGRGRSTIYVRDETWSTYPLTASDLKKVDALLPRPFYVDANVPLPDAVPLSFLSKGGSPSKSVALGTRSTRLHLIQKLLAIPAAFTETAKSVSDHAGSFVGLAVEAKDAADPHAEAKWKLADVLLVNIAGVGRDHFVDLIETIGDGRDGYVDGVEELINRALSTKLNFRRWWTQDRSFQLRVTVRESDIAFIVRDRTGTHYSFSERSGGLSYYLSYFVQYLSHRPRADGDEILLMDEPDAYLSSQGQKDLLRIFDAFAHPEAGDGVQVAYVTHSPFLVDKNHAERIRVIEKGEGDEGTRVVGDVGRNHYEPLRSAFGAFVGETTFMGSCNLMVEGISDQILLAGMSNRLRRTAAPVTDYLNLNDVTIVPAGGAPHIPYLVYLARGRDIEKPAVIVLLDGDEAGEKARRDIKKGGAYRRALISDDLVLQLDDAALNFVTDRNQGVRDIEDLIPLELAVQALVGYARDFVGTDKVHPEVPAKAEGGVFATASAVVNAALPEPIDFEKVGFARAVLNELQAHDRHAGTLSGGGVDRLESNFRDLFRRLSQMQRSAMRERSDAKSAERIARARDAFLADHPSGASRVDVIVLFEEITHALDDSLEAEDIRSETRRLVAVHDLHTDSALPVSDWDGLCESFRALEYRGRIQSQEGAMAVSRERPDRSPDP